MKTLIQVNMVYERKAVCRSIRLTLACLGMLLSCYRHSLITIGLISALQNAVPLLHNNGHNGVGLSECIDQLLAVTSRLRGPRALNLWSTPSYCYSLGRLLTVNHYVIIRQVVIWH